MGSYVSMYFKILIVMALIYMVMYIPKPFMKWLDVNYVCRTVVRATESAGEINQDVEDLLETLIEERKLKDVEVEWEGNFVDHGASRRIQLNERFSLSIRTSVKIKFIRSMFGKDLEIDIPIPGMLRGISDEYWKPGQI